MKIYSKGLIERTLSSGIKQYAPWIKERMFENKVYIKKEALGYWKEFSPYYYKTREKAEEVLYDYITICKEEEKEKRITYKTIIL